MRKLLIGLLVAIIMVTTSGCVRVTNAQYKEGTYHAFDPGTKYSVVVYIDNKGVIKSVFFDAIYMTGCAQRGVLDPTCTITTKQTLGEEYGMRSKSADIGVIENGAEWYEQVNTFAEKVVKEQSIDWVVFKYKDEDGKTTNEQPEGKTEDDKVYTDSVAGVTIIVNNLYRLVNDALEQAKV